MLTRGRDAAGVVYYGNYPGYMERARNACLRRGWMPAELAEALGQWAGGDDFTTADQQLGAQPGAQSDE